MVGWIEILFKRHARKDFLSTGTLLRTTREQIGQEAGSHPGGRAALRREALKQLADPMAREFALVTLSVVGRADDVDRLETLPPSRALRVCRFELRRPS